MLSAPYCQWRSGAIWKPKSEQVQVNTTTTVDLTAKRVSSVINLIKKVDQTIREYFKINNTDPDNTQYRAG